MIPMLFFLLTITVFGTAYYLYLRQEQSKAIPKDKYDEAWNEFYKHKEKKKKNIKQDWQDLLAILYRPTLLFYTFVIISIIYGLLYIFLAPDSNPFLNIFAAFLFIFLSPVFIILFPSGLIAFITQTDIGNSSIGIGWLMYFVIFLFGIFARDRSVFIIIYLVLIALLAMNCIGCAQFGVCTFF